MEKNYFGSTTYKEIEMITQQVQVSEPTLRQLLEETLQHMRNLSHDVKALEQKIKNIEDRQEAIWQDVNTLISIPKKEE